MNDLERQRKTLFLRMSNKSMIMSNTRGEDIVMGKSKKSQKTKGIKNSKITIKQKGGCGGCRRNKSK